MKKLLLILTIPFIFSCSKEDNNHYTKSDLLGFWDIESRTYSETSVNINDCNSQSSLNFVSEDVIITYAYIDDEDECVVFDIDFEYRIEENSIFIDNEGLGEFRFYAEIIDNNTIRLEQTYDGSELLKTVSTFKRR